LPKKKEKNLKEEEKERKLVEQEKKRYFPPRMGRCG